LAGNVLGGDEASFWAKTAVAAFDRLGQCVAELAISIANTPRQYVFRTVDDVPIITPAASSAGPIFASTYRGICADLNIMLAPDCADFEKAFTDSTVGTILGIRFETVTLTWTLSDRKLDDILRAINSSLTGQHMTLAAMQHLMGTLNHFGQMCPLLKAFRLPLNLFLSDLLHEPEEPYLCPIRRVLTFAYGPL
jgi:hypothetical protein